MLVIAATGAIYGHMEMEKAAKAQDEVIEAGYSLQTAQLLDKYQQLNAQAADEVGERAREQRIELARLKAIGAEAGLGGISQDRVERESSFLAGQDIATIEANRGNALRQAQNEGRAAQIETRARSAAVSRPSAVGTGLQIATAAGGAYNASEERAFRARQQAKT